MNLHKELQGLPDFLCAGRYYCRRRLRASALCLTHSKSVPFSARPKETRGNEVKENFREKNSKRFFSRGAVLCGKVGTEERMLVLERRKAKLLGVDVLMSDEGSLQTSVV